MKKIILGIVAITFSIATMAQTNAVDRLFDKYADKDGYTSVLVTKYMFQLFEKVASDKDDKDFKEITRKLTGIKILTIDSAVNVKRGHSFYKEIISSLPASEYKDLMVIKEKGQEVKFMIREDNGRISELLMVAGGDDAVLIALQGDIDLKQVSKLSKSMNIKGFERLDKVHDKK